MNTYIVVNPEGDVLVPKPLSLAEAFEFLGGSNHWQIHAACTREEIDALPTSISNGSKRLTVAELRAFRAPAGSRHPGWASGKPRFKVGDLVHRNSSQEVFPVLEVEWVVYTDGWAGWRVHAAGIAADEYAFVLARP